MLQYSINRGQKFEVIVSNPPYIKEDSYRTLMEDVKNYEPYVALYGGEDGLDFYRKITNKAYKLLNKGGILIFEIGYDQNESVSDILKQNGFYEIECIKDLAGKDRVVKGKLEICC